MRTITFYSYKGGVGRSLALANVATELAMSLGKKVFALDVDLEAPGLHYKLLEDKQREAVKKGVVDYIYEFYTSSSHEMPARLEDFVCQVDLPGANGSLWLMPAGNVPASEYWQRLSRIAWHEFFFGSDSLGIPFFLELQERIRRTYTPDFLLIDARTGITGIGGMAVTLLPDQVVCLLAHNPENMEGARAVLRSIKSAPRMEGQAEIEIVPVVTRIPLKSSGEPDQARDEDIANRIREFLNGPASPGADSIRTTEIVVLHSEPELQVEERLLLGGQRRIAESPLARDYRRLFERIIPTEGRKGELDVLELIVQLNQASRLREQAKYDEARELGEQVLAGMRQELGEEHPDTLLAINNLALTLFEKGELKRARELQEKVLEAQRRVGGKVHPNTLVAMGNLATTLQAQGELERAQELQEKALEAWCRTRGEQHPDTLIAMSNLGLTLQMQGELRGAQELHENALEAWRRVRGEEHFDTYLTMTNLAGTLHEQGASERARGLLEQAIAGFRQKLGAEHHYVFRALCLLAMILHAQGQAVHAREVAEQAVEGLRRGLGEQHRWTLAAMANLATILHAQGELAEERQIRERVLEARRQVLGEQHPDTLEIKASLNS